MMAAFRSPYVNMLTGLAVVVCLLSTSCSSNTGSRQETAKGSTTSVPHQVAVSGWLPYWDDGSGLESFQQNVSKFESIHPFWYEATGTTTISSNADAKQKSAVLSAAHANGVKVVPTVSGNIKPANFKSITEDPVSRGRHVTAICDLVADNDYDGIDINYEHFAVSPPSQDIGRLADLFVTFVEELATCIHRMAKSLEVTVMARSDDSLLAPYRPKLAIGVYDYERLGKVADRIRPMAYDYSYPGGPAGSLAPIAWVEDVIEYATAKVPASHLVLGVPTYGQDWAGTGASVLTSRDGTAVALRHGSTPVRDQQTGSVHFEYSSDGKNHSAWYDDSAATLQKVELARSHGLHGISMWALGYESPDIWSDLGR
jgi:spore germination protein